jgi:secondary thiamine-phosphate synthase enzyme
MRTTIDDGVAMKIHRAAIQRVAHTAPEFIDITDEVAAAVEASGIQDGTVTVFSRHTTAAVKINENEPLLLRDMARFLETSAPREAEYRHNDFVIRTANMTDDECPNGHSHCQHLMLSASETIPVMGGRLALGRWQSVFLVELDRPREREVVIQVLGF